MTEYNPIRDKDGREVSVSDTGSRTTIGIHSWSMGWGHSAMTPEQEAPSRSIFFDLENAKRVRDDLTREIDFMEYRSDPTPYDQGKTYAIPMCRASEHEDTGPEQSDVQTVLVRPYPEYDGGMVGFLDPTSGKYVGCCGINYWRENAREVS